ncbi:biotin--[acetyl-CoA-carboxylase] ligase [Fusobacterium mortiferum]|uniref:biotin--[biotin carboxyl-carrier protein] ligase n=1 Tax=Fusobacterium mortiferum TaxID=850 RepID=A0ABS2FZ81_FUSMR|nr:biotin--[acetyl-CoA-carboxylase] ligase [Fusobacterium mortiferum]MBM6874449.1 biotin--[acetyl-CoA-carboxylase] ligase [Fusobacterium mortiferum]
MRVFRFDEIDSTNKFLKEQNNLQDYDCVIAKTQTAGVGRRGNVWVSNEGMAIFSFALKEAENISLEEYMRLPLIAGISVLSGLKKIEDLDYKFKWTNDIYLDDKKLCGILVEKTKDFFIIGIGININNSDFGYAQDRAISLKNKTGNFYRIEDIIFCIINEFKRYFSEDWSFVLKEINSYNYLKDKEIEIVKYGESLGVGVAKDIAEDGRLIVEIDGQEKLFNIGEIHIRK